MLSHWILAQSEYGKESDYLGTDYCSMTSSSKQASYVDAPRTQKPNFCSLPQSIAGKTETREISRIFQTTSCSRVLVCVRMAVNLQKVLHKLLKFKWKLSTTVHVSILHSSPAPGSVSEEAIVLFWLFINIYFIIAMF